jgi:Trypsin
MRKTLLLFTTMALALLLAAGMASAITYGQLDGNRHPNVGVAVLADAQGVEGLCGSGTLIAPDVFVTAAHCMFGFEQDGFEFRGVSFDNPYDPGTSVVLPGTLHFHPDYVFPGHNSDPKDLAVVVLDDPVAGIRPASLPRAGLLDQMAKAGTLKGQRFTVVGYGDQERTHEPGSGTPVRPFDGARRYAVSSFKSLTSAQLRLAQNPSTGDGGACFGDSGGPNFLGAGPSETNIIVSVGAFYGDFQCRSMNVTYRLDTPSARAFLGQFVPLP